MGSIFQFFMDSKVTLYKDMWNYASSRGHFEGNDATYISKVGIQ